MPTGERGDSNLLRHDWDAAMLEEWLAYAFRGTSTDGRRLHPKSSASGIVWKR
jgi:hypothetical protein